jgi:hypothetical protein
MFRSPSPEKRALWEQAVQKRVPSIRTAGLQHDHDSTDTECGIVRFFIELALKIDGAPLPPNTVASVKVRTSPVTRGSPYVIFTRSHEGSYVVFGR